MGEYTEAPKKSIFKKFFASSSFYEEVCEKISENKHWPFEDYGPFFARVRKTIVKLISYTNLNIPLGRRLLF
jgi:hypothetical protein